MYKSKEEGKKAWEAGVRETMELLARVWITQWVRGIGYACGHDINGCEKANVPSEEVMWKAAGEYELAYWESVTINNFSNRYTDHPLRPYTNLEQRENESLDDEERELAKDFLAQYTTEEVERIFKEYAREAFSKAYAEAKERAKVLYPKAKFEA